MGLFVSEMKTVLHEVVVDRIIGSPLIPSAYRWVLYRAVGKDVGRSLIFSGCHIGSGEIRIGRGVFVNRNVFIDASAAVHIEDGVWIAMNSSIVTSTHTIGDADRRAGRLQAKPVTIGAGSWLGAHVVVAPGVTIGRGCVVGANSLVNKDCEPNGLYVGSPARRIRDLDAAQPQNPHSWASA
jgi:maltose O-acetyltransferase